MEPTVEEINQEQLEAMVKTLAQTAAKGELDSWMQRVGVSTPEQLRELTKSQGAGERGSQILSSALAAALWAKEELKPKGRGVKARAAADALMIAMAWKHAGKSGSPEQILSHVSKTWTKASVERVEKALAASSFSGGGALIPEELSSEMIELLRSATLVRRMGARSLTVPNGKLNIGRQNSGATSAYLSEGNPIIISQPSFGQLVLDLKKQGTLVPVSNDLLRFGGAEMASIVAEDMLAQHAVAEDRAFIRSDGSLSRPIGIRDSVASFNRFAQAGTTLDNITSDLSKLQYRVTGADITGTMPGWMLHPRSFYHLLSLRDGNGNFVWMDMLSQGQLYGAPIGLSTSIPNNLGGGTETELYFGYFDQLIIGEGPSVEFEESSSAGYNDGVGQANAFQRDETLFRLIAHNDIVLRHNRAFAVLTGVTWGAALDA